MQQQVIKVETVGPIKPPMATQALTPDEAAKGHNTVTMIFDNPVTLTIEHGKTVAYPAGVHEVPVEWKDHWYLAAHNVRQYNKPVPVAADVPTKPSRGNRSR